MIEVIKSIKANLVYFSTIDGRIWIITTIIIVSLFAFIFLERKDKCVKDSVFMTLLALVCALIVVVTLTGRTEISNSGWEWLLFTSYKKAIRTRNMALIIQICFNIVAFIPVGILTPLCLKNSRKYLFTVIIVFLATTCIEIIQGIARIGLFESDDILNNLIGTGIGMTIHYIVTKLNILLRNHKGKEKC